MRISTTMRSTIVTGVAGLVSLGGVAAACPAWTPPDDTITRITGSASNGFTIEHYDGSVLYPPTRSEAVAECSEYDTRLKRVRCKVEVRTWYAALGDTRRALRYARTR